MTAPKTRPAGAPARSDDAGARAVCSALSSGDLIGEKYRFESIIAEGGMGVVLRATHVELGNTVAIKVVRPEHAANEEVVARLLAEAKIAACLRSKHVNRVLDVGRFPSGVPYLVLEYLEGSDLAERLNEVGRFSTTQACDLVLQACEGLAEAHAIGIVHRDLKPENLFLSEEPDGEQVLKILDFGISKAPRAAGERVLTKPWHVVGSPCYMAPEQMQGADVDGRADVWALGVVLYELCAGRLPFDSPSVKDIFLRVLREEPLPPSWLVEGIDPAFEHIIFKCLRKAAEDRYQSVVELAEALRPFASDPTRVSRVGKVAETTAGRLTRARTPGVLVDALSPTTPLTLAASRLPRGRSTPRASRRRRAAWMLGASAAASVALGAAFSSIPRLATSRATSAALTPPIQSSVPLPGEAATEPFSRMEAPRYAPPAVAPPLPQRPLVAPPPIATPGLASSAVARAGVVPARSKPAAPATLPAALPAVAAPRRAPANANGVALELRSLPESPVESATLEPATLVEAVPEAAAAQPSSPAPDSTRAVNAWDRSTFGGRR